MKETHQASEVFHRLIQWADNRDQIRAMLLTIPLDHLIYRIAWYELHGQRSEAIALRLLVAECQPPYEVDEAWVQAEMDALRKNLSKTR